MSSRYNNSEVIPMRDIGKNIKIIRQSKNMTQDAFAEALYVTRQTISNYENGRSRPDLDTLLRIAEVLDTDINTLFYGPPVPKSKKDAYKWLGISFGILLLTGIIFFTVKSVFTNNPVYWPTNHYIIWINELIPLPVIMLVLGWILLHILGMVCNLQQLRPPKFRVGKIVLLIILGLLFAIPIPYIIYYALLIINDLSGTIDITGFPYIPLWQEAFLLVGNIIRHASFVYILLGGLCWLFGLPRIQKLNME